MIESLASSADKDNKTIDYARMIEAFRHLDKKCSGYLTKSQYKRFLHDMNIYQTNEFEEITFKGLISENISKKSNEEYNNSHSANSPAGLTFEMARIVYEAFNSYSIKPKDQQNSKRKNSTDLSHHCSEKNLYQYKNNSGSSSDGENDGDEIKLERTKSAPLGKNVHSIKSKKDKKLFKTKICSLILFRGVDDDRDGKINYEQFHSISKIVDDDLSDDETLDLFNSCLPDDEKLVTYSNVAKNLFDVFAWGNEDPYHKDLVTASPSSKLCILI